MKLERIALAVPLLIMILILIAVPTLLFGWWEYWPEDDPATQEECIESHSELTSVSSNGVPSYATVCDKTRIKQCVRWKQERTWAGKPYRTCVEYE